MYRPSVMYPQLAPRAMPPPPTRPPQHPSQSHSSPAKAPIPARAAPVATAAAAEQPMAEAKAGQGRSWSDDQMQQARQTAVDLFDAPLSDSGKHRVRVTWFGGTVGVDLRDFFLGQYGELKDKWLPGKKGIRLRPDEWAALKAVSGDVDAALQQAAEQQPGSR